MASLLKWASDRKKDLGQAVDVVSRGASRVVDQVNPLDNGRTYQQRTPTRSMSAGQQLTHNGLTNMAGDNFAKPLLRGSFAVNQGLGNLERKIGGKPTLNASQFYANSPATESLRKFSGYTGTKRQIVGDAITNVANIAAPASSKLLEQGIKSVAPKIPQLAVKAASNAAVGAPVGAIGNVGSVVSSEQPLTKDSVVSAAKQGALIGAAGGAILPIAAKVGGKAATGALTKVQEANKQAGLKAATAKAGVQDIPINRLTATDQAGYGEVSRPRVDYYKQEIAAGRKPAAIIVVKDKAGTHFVEDGKHRLQAYKELGIKNVPSKVTTPEILSNLRQGGYVGGIPDELVGEASPAKRTPANSTSTSKDSLSVPPIRQASRTLPTTIPENMAATATAPPPPIKPPKQAIAAPAGDIQPAPGGTIAPAVNPMKTSRYASKTIPNSDYVGEQVSTTTKQNAPGYIPTTERGRYTESLGGVKEKGLDNFSTDVQSRLDVPDGKVGHQDVADAQTAAQLLEARGGEGDFQRAADIYDKVSGHLTAAGQTVQAASLLARRSPSGLLYKAIRDLKRGGVEITPELQTKVKQLVDEYKATPENSRARDMAVAKLSKLVVDSVPQSLVDNAISVWKAGLLSGAKTHGGNIISNTVFGGLKKVSDIPSVATDKAISLVTGKRTVAGTARGIVSGTAEGTKSGLNTLKTGIDPRNIGDKYEQHAGINFKNKAVQKVLGDPANKVFNLLSAADQPFYYAALKNSLYDMGKADGINRGLRGSALKHYMDTFVDNPSVDVMQRATVDANKAVLGYDTFASKAISAVHKGIDNMPGASEPGKRVANAVVNILAPFVRVPSAFISRTIDYTPLGIGKEVFSQVAHKQFDQRALSKAIGEGITGTGVIALGIALTQQNLLSGDYPKNDPKEAQRWKAEGITPNSVKLGGKWVSLNYLGPIGLLFNAGRSMENAHGEDELTKAGVALGGLGQGLLGQSFLQGFSGFSDAIQDPERNLKSFVNSQGSSLVPSIVNDVATATDKFQRQADTLGQSVKNRIPGLRETNPVKQDVYGNKLERQSTALDVVNPLKPSNNLTKDNPVLLEVNRLHTTDPTNSDLQVTPTAIKKTVTFDGVNTDLTEQQRLDLQAKVGQATQKAWGELIPTSEYKALSDADKANALNNLRADMTSAVKSQYAAENNLGQYSTNFEGNAKSPTKVVSAILSGGVNVNAYAKSGDSAAAVSSEPDAEYKAAKSKYDADKKAGKITPIRDVARQQTLKKLEVGAKYDKDVRDLYTLSKANIYSYITNDKNGKKLADQLKSYDDSLYNAGLSTYKKFTDTKGNVSFAPKAKSGRKGKSTKTNVTQLTGALKPPKVTALRRSTFRTGSTKAPKFKVPKLAKAKTRSNSALNKLLTSRTKTA